MAPRITGAAPGQPMLGGGVSGGNAVGVAAEHFVGHLGDVELHAVAAAEADEDVGGGGLGVGAEFFLDVLVEGAALLGAGGAVGFGGGGFVEGVADGGAAGVGGGDGALARGGVAQAAFVGKGLAGDEGAAGEGEGGVGLAGLAGPGVALLVGGVFGHFHSEFGHALEHGEASGAELGFGFWLGRLHRGE